MLSTFPKNKHEQAQTSTATDSSSQLSEKLTEAQW